MGTTGDMPIEYARLSKDDFPFTMQHHDEETGELLWEATVTGPGPLVIPSHHPRKVRTTILAKDGSVLGLNDDGSTDDYIVDDDDQTAVIACAPYDPSEYSPLRLGIWQRSVVEFEAKGMLAPRVYAGSVEARCSECNIRVGVGPRQQEELLKFADQGVPVMITCLICSTMLMAQPDTESRVMSLGNPEDPND